MFTLILIQVGWLDFFIVGISFFNVIQYPSPSPLYRFDILTASGDVIYTIFLFLLPWSPSDVSPFSVSNINKLWRNACWNIFFSSGLVLWGRFWLYYFCNVICFLSIIRGLKNNVPFMLNKQYLNLQTVLNFYDKQLLYIRERTKTDCCLNRLSTYQYYI